MGGAATNSGINYQQRIAALALASLYTKFDLSQTFGLDRPLLIESIHFETDDPIDDLKLISNNGSFYLQIKRSLSLQTEEGTDLYKTINQFVTQFLKRTSNDHFILATSPQSSRSITQDFAKITESIRLNDSSFSSNPLNKSEKETLDKFKSLFNTIFELQSKKKASENDFIEFAKKVYISSIDIEQGKPNEQVALILLNSERMLDPTLVWKMLISNSLEYARKRQSINSKALEEILHRYKVESKKQGSDEISELEELLKTEIIQQGYFPVAKEVLLIESFAKEADLLIVELFRFSDDGKIRHKFRGDKVILENGEEWKIVHRAATFLGMERFISENKDKLHLSKKKIAVIPANGIDEAENTDGAELHRKYLLDLQSRNTDILKCLHCDKPLNPSGSVLVEISDIETKPAMGAVHSKCLRVVDRVLGLTGTLKSEATKDKHLQEFDFKEWARCLMKGQGMINQLKNNPFIQNQDKMILWSSDNKEFRDYGYCVKFNMSDGSTIHMTDRGRIHRFNKTDAELAALQMTESVKRAKDDGNPMAFTSRKNSFGNYSQLLELKDSDETIIEIDTVEIDKYSKLLEKRDEHINFYAPMCLVRSYDDESILNLNNIVPIISDPLAFGSIFETWKNLGIDIDPNEVELKILQTDVEFDGFMRSCFADGMFPIIDPLFDKKGNLVKGIQIKHMEQEFAVKSELHRKSVIDPHWKKGDKVKIEFPFTTVDNYPVGVLVEDEFLIGDGERYVIFRPIENGKELKDMTFSVPSRLLAYWN